MDTETYAQIEQDLKDSGKERPNKYFRQDADRIRDKERNK